MILDPEKMLRGKSKSIIERTANFVGFTPALDANSYIATGTASYDGLAQNLTNDVLLGEEYGCGIESFHFDFARLTIAEFTLENLVCDARHILTLQLTTESGNNSITVCGASDGSDGNTQTLLRLRCNSENAADIIVLPKHNIADTVGKAYCITLRVNKNDNRVSLLTNGQLLGYYTYTAITLSKLGVSCFKATITAPETGRVNVGIGQIKTRLYY